MKLCFLCKKEFEPTYHTKKYCSETCSKQAQKNQHKEFYQQNRTEILQRIKKEAYTTKKCLVCEKEFLSYHNVGKTCSKQCKKIVYHNKYEKPRTKIMNCFICRQEFQSYHGIQKICSSKCRKTLDKINADRWRNKPNAQIYKKGWQIQNREVIKARNKEQYEQNKEEILRKNKEYRLKNREQLRLISKERRQKNREKIRADKKKRYISLKDRPAEQRTKFLDKCRQYRQHPQYKEKRKMWAKKYYSTENGKMTSQKRSTNRRAREKEIINNLSRQDIAEIKNKYSHCVYCLGQDRLAYEHITAVAKKGGTTKENIIRACIHCNGSKKDIILDEWLNTFYCKSKNIKKEEINIRIQQGC